MGYFGHGKQADHIEVKKDLHLSVVLCLFWHFFRKGSKRIDFRRIGIAVLHIFLLHGPLTPYACIFSFNADSLNWLPTNPEFRVIVLGYSTASTLPCVSARLLWLKLPDICP